MIKLLRASIFTLEGLYVQYYLCGLCTTLYCTLL